MKGKKKKAPLKQKPPGKKPRAARGGEGVEVPEEEDVDVEVDEGEGRTGDGAVLFGLEDDDACTKKRSKKSGGFQSMDLSPPIFQAIMKKGYRMPTPIQRKSIPVGIRGDDIVAMARTGSGKTAAFLIPILERLKVHAQTFGARAVILEPTRELALQTLKFAKELARFTDLRLCLLVGGDSMEDQFADLANYPDIIIATPGRLMHHLIEVGMSLKSVVQIVFDEADRLFEMGFAQQLHEILHALSENRQTLLFSATMPSQLAEFARAGLRNPTVIRLDAEAKLSENLKTAFFCVRAEEKLGALLYILRELVGPEQQSVVFTSTRHHVEFLGDILKASGTDASLVYGSMDQTARKISIARFRNRTSKVLIVTDVAARGIDIPLLDNVINFDFPPKPKLFVHRVGRAARAGRSGMAFSLVTADELAFVLDLHLYLGQAVHVAKDTSEDGSTGYIGTFPMSALDIDMDSVREILKSNPELESLKRVTDNAHKLYVKTRPQPSAESVRRAKIEVVQLQAIHPLLSARLNSSEQVRNSYLSALRKFRPPHTILEIKEAKCVGGADAMRNKRAWHGVTIQKQKKRKAGDEALHMGAEESDASDDQRSTSKATHALVHARESASFKDEGFYIAPQPRNRHIDAAMSIHGGGGPQRLEDLVMDLGAEDNDQVKLRKNQMVWDKKKKNFVQAQSLLDSQAGNSSGTKRKIHTESGQVITTSYAAGMYKAWSEKNKISIPSTGAVEDSSQRSMHNHGKRWKHKNPAPAENKKIATGLKPKNELKSVDHIKKERKEKMAKKGRGGGSSRGRGGGGKGGGGRGGGGRGGSFRGGKRR